MLKAIIVDDEIRCIENLNLIIENFCTGVEIIGTYREIDVAYDAIDSLKPDIVFLDVDMPPYTGFDLLRKYDELPFEVIFVTAYNYYAIDAIKFSALDYIMKPVKSDELQIAITKAKKRVLKQAKISTDYFRHLDSTSSQINKILINSAKKSELVSLEDIIYLEAAKSYTIIYLKSNKSIVCSQRNLKEYEELLKDKGFFRTHKSFLVNIKEIEAIDKQNGTEIITKQEQRIPLAFRRKNAFLKLFKI